ncbi:hypothetical protein BGZ81_002995 [Podila clonocystis]|nr:hypothetical protein BGZ81_002995 [Podila clonocystis]
MGLITPLCFTTDGTSLYALATVPDSGVDNMHPSRTILTNPTSLLDISWTLISSIRSDRIYSFRVTGAGQVDCAVDANGAFTAFGIQGLFPGIENATKWNPLGLRYDPTLPANIYEDSRGPGGWTNLSLSSNYNWAAGSADHTLFVVPTDSSSSAKQDTIHVYIESTTRLVFGRVNMVSKLLEKITSWEIPQPTSEYLDHLNKVTYWNGDIYYRIGHSFTSSHLPYSTIPAAFPQSGNRVFNGSWVGSNNCYPDPIGGLRDTFYAVCDELDQTQYDKPAALSILDLTRNGSSFSAPMAFGSFKKNYTAFYCFIPMPGGSGSNQVPFAFAYHYEGIISVDLPSKAQSMALSWKSLPTGISVPDFGDGGTASSGSGTSSGGIIAGSVVGVLAVVAAVAYFGYFRRRVQKRKLENKMQENVPSRDQQKTEAVSGPGGAVQYIVRPTEIIVPDHSGIYSRGPAPGVHQASVQAHSQFPAPVQELAYQIQIQQPQFASHPRPSVVTIVGSAQDEVKGGSAESVPGHSVPGHIPFIPGSDHTMDSSL